MPGRMASLSPKEITIRPAAFEDAAQIADIGVRVFTKSFGHAVPPEELQSYLNDSYSIDATTKEISNPEKDMIVATAQEVVVGFALLTRGSSEPCIEHLNNAVELQRIYVDNTYHSNGVGGLLAAKLEAMAREQGFKYMWLGCWQENPSAQRFYEKLGYRIVGAHGFPIGKEVHTDNILLKEL